jgi:pyruvate/2-oxoglutarate dehydrogenase complex dihydrolipoamide dehydrogenase (E3) component
VRGGPIVVLVVPADVVLALDVDALGIASGVHASTVPPVAFLLAFGTGGRTVFHWFPIVLGGDMAGLPVAMKCAYSGMETVLVDVEEDLLGDTCPNRGCIPTRTMLRNAEIANLARRSEEFGIDIDRAIRADTDAIVERKDGVVESIREGAYENVGSNENIGFVEGHDVFESAHEIRVGDRTLSAETAVVNAGARPAKPPIDGLDDIEVHDSTDLLERESVPESLAVIGGGYVGCEYARMHGRFGADSPSSSAGSLLPDEDPAVSEVIEHAFEDERINRPDGCARHGARRDRRRRPRRR